MNRKKYFYISVLALILIGIGGFILVTQEGFPGKWSYQPQATTTAYALPSSRPQRLRIPALHIDTGFVPLGLDGNKEIEVPDSYTDVGWYTYGPTPGELGPAVVLGHVDSYTGPAVFYSLGQLQPGDQVEIEREDGTIAIFRVDELKRYSQDTFPTQEVYGNIDHAGLRLITCSGQYDRKEERYDRNLVVYASLIDSQTHNF